MTELFKKHRAKKAQGKKGFTLIELIVVVAILAVLAGVLIPVVGNALSDSKTKVANSDASAVASALNQMSAFGEVDLSTAVAAGVLTLTNDQVKNLQTRVPGINIKAAADVATIITNVATSSATINDVKTTAIVGLNYNNGDQTGKWGTPYTTA